MINGSIVDVEGFNEKCCSFRPVAIEVSGASYRDSRRKNGVLALKY